MGPRNSARIDPLATQLQLGQAETLQQAASGGTFMTVLSFVPKEQEKGARHRMRERTETVIAAYRPKPGKSQALRKLIHEHRRKLHEAHLITSRPAIVLRARSDGTLLEIFEWISAKAADEAHQHPSIRAMWSKLAEVADFIPLSAVEEAGKAFSHFEGLNTRQTKVRALSAARPAARRPTR